MKKILVYILIILGNITFSKMTVGVTMLPYYSFVKNIVGDKMEVVSIVPENINSHNYNPTPQDIKNLKNVDIVVLNGIGHDEFAEKMISASSNKNIEKIYANENVLLMETNGKHQCEHDHDGDEHDHHDNGYNAHTFISITQSIAQIDNIAEKLSKIDKKNKNEYMRNAMTYTRKLRKLLINSKLKLKNVDISNIKVATTHSGYDYLLAEFGISVEAVVESSSIHSVTAVDLKNAIDIINKEKIDILFDEENSNHKNARAIKAQTGVYISELSHLTNGKYTKDAFEIFIAKNLDEIVNALLKVKK